MMLAVNTADWSTALQVGKSVSHTVAVVMAVLAACVIGVSEGGGVSLEDVVEQHWTRSDHLTTSVVVVVVVVVVVFS